MEWYWIAALYVIGVIGLLGIGFYLGCVVSAVEIRRQMDRGFIEIGDEVFSVTKKRMNRR